MSEVSEGTLKTFMYENLEAENARLRKRISDLETKDVRRLEWENDRLRDAIIDIKVRVDRVMGNIE